MKIELFFTTFHHLSPFFAIFPHLSSKSPGAFPPLSRQSAGFAGAAALSSVGVGLVTWQDVYRMGFCWGFKERWMLVAVYLYC